MIPGSASPFFLGSSLAVGGGGGGGYQIERSLRFNSSDSAYLSRTPSSAGNLRTWTFSCWIKRSGLGGGQRALFSAGTGDVNVTRIVFDGDSLYALHFVGGTVGELKTTAVFRDPSAYYHVVFSCDTTQSTAAERWKFWINGTQVTTLSIATYPPQNTDTYINGANKHALGAQNANTITFFQDGYLAECYLIDGQALTPSSFTEVSATTGQLIPKAYTGSFGTNGFWLKFSDNSNTTATTLGKDYSGNSNNWTPNNLSVTAGAGNDSLVDTPTSYGTDTGAGGEVRGNYCTFNALAGYGTLANGNLEVSSTIYRTGTIAVTSGKWYYELTAGSVAVNSYAGVYTDSGSPFSGYVNWGTGGYYSSVGGTNNFSSGAITQGDIIGVAFDRDNGTLSIYRNGTYLGQYSGLSLGATPWYLGMHTNASAATPWVINFGQRAFAYTAPSGFKALCDTNLGAPVVAKPNTVMDVALFAGNGGTNTISGLQFAPDFVWVKSRSNAYGHNLHDIIRGNSSYLVSSTTAAEVTAYPNICVFNSDGFTLSADSSANVNGTTNVGWAWDAGTSTVSNTSGSITSQVRANASAGFSIVTYTGTGSSASVGHGLGVAPAFYVTKRRDSSSFGNWTVYHSGVGTQTLELNSTGAAFSDSTRWPSAATSTVFNIGSNGNVNTNGGTYVAYVFSPVAGYSSFGSYVGTGTGEGAFVYTGFRPRWIMIKSSDFAGGNWAIIDAARDTYNVTTKYLGAEGSYEEQTLGLGALDILSNGFKLKYQYDLSNRSGVTYIYAAFAENPFQYARAR